MKRSGPFGRGAWLFAVGVLVAPACSGSREPAARDTNAGAENGSYRAAAESAATWIRSTAVASDRGTSWPADPYDTASVVSNLYTGTPGVVLFFLELAANTGNEAYLQDARGGADYLVHRLQATDADALASDAGLYTGLAGIGFVLNETFKATGDTQYRDGALHAVERIHALARRHDSGVDWADSTDIISGSAGTGLFLLYVAREFQDPASQELAAAAGRLLIKQAETGAGGLAWRINPDLDRLYPNFSHGTAGVAYYLAALYEATGEQEFLDAALSGAAQLLELAETEGDICLVYHHAPGGEELQYLSWCHGPAGTARTFYKLWQVTGDSTWLDWTERAANGVYGSGIPEQRTEGFWNNVGQCCGSAGVAEFSLAMRRVDGEDRHLEFARVVADDLLGRATEDSGGLMWVQAEHRVRPDFLVAQTGFMQGAAGIGILLLHLDAAVHDRDWAGIIFPDSPF